MCAARRFLSTIEAALDGFAARASKQNKMLEKMKALQVSTVVLTSVNEHHHMVSGQAV